MQGIIAARMNSNPAPEASSDATSSPPVQPIIKSEFQHSSSSSSSYWSDTAGANSNLSPVGLSPVGQNFSTPYVHPGGGVYVPGVPPNPGAVMAQAVGTFGYPAELNGDGTWQQLMVQLGVIEGQPGS
jgi:hypothetical protein